FAIIAFKLTFTANKKDKKKNAIKLLVIIALIFVVGLPIIQYQANNQKKWVNESFIPHIMALEEKESTHIKNIEEINNRFEKVLKVTLEIDHIEHTLEFVKDNEFTDDKNHIGNKRAVRYGNVVFNKNIDSPKVIYKEPKESIGKEYKDIEYYQTI